MKSKTMKKVAALVLSAVVAVGALPVTSAFAAETTDSQEQTSSEVKKLEIGTVTNGALSVTTGAAASIKVTTGQSVQLTVTGSAISTQSSITFKDGEEVIVFNFAKDENESDVKDLKDCAAGTYKATTGSGIAISNPEDLDNLTIEITESKNGETTDPTTKPGTTTDPTTKPGTTTNPGGSTGGGSTGGSGSTTTPTTPSTPSTPSTPDTPTTPSTPSTPSTPDKPSTAKPAATGTTLKDTKKNTYKVSSSKNKTVQYTGTKSKASNVKVPATVKINGVTYKVTSIKSGAFKGNKTAKTITIGNNVKTIGKNAFANCKKLTTVKLGKNVSKIGASAFSGSKKLKTITINSKKLTSSSLSKTAFKGISSKTTIKVPKSKVNTYKKLFVKKGLSKKVKIKAI